MVHRFEDERTKSLVVACLDGHGTHGHIISQYFQQQLRMQLPQHPRFAHDIEGAVSEVLCALEFELYRMKQRLADFSGTTLSLAIIRDGKITVANIGDSRTVLVRRAMSGSRQEPQLLLSSNCSSDSLCTATERTRSSSLDSHSSIMSSTSTCIDSPPSCKRRCCALQSMALSTDHKPDFPIEHRRIMTAGGRVFSIRYDDGSIGPARVWLSNMNLPGLAMSRSLGDFVVHTAGVISTPDFCTYQIQPDEDMYLIVATDGLWDQVSGADAAAIIEDAALMSSTEVPPVEQIAQQLWQESRRRWLACEKTGDDTTIAVVQLSASSGLTVRDGMHL